MEFGLFTEFQAPAGRTDSAAFDESMAQMRLAEDLGYDAVWLAELHFQKDRSPFEGPAGVRHRPERAARDPRHPEEGVDAGALLAQRALLRVQQIVKPHSRGAGRVDTSRSL